MASETCGGDADESSNAWQEHSFFLEVKQRAELSSLFVDCRAMAIASDAKTFLRVGNNCLEIHSDNENDSLGETKFVAKIASIHISPNSVCDLTWTDPHRHVFMCKVRVDSDSGVTFPRKSFRVFEESLRCRLPISECVDELLDAFDQMKVTCRQCHYVLHEHAKSDVEFGVLPEDEWLDTSPSMEYFCGQSCGHGTGSCDVNHHIVDHQPHHQRHHPHPYYDGQLGFSSLAATSSNAAQQWLPNASKVVFSDSFLLLLADEALKQRVERVEEKRILICRQCFAQVGIPLRAHPDVFKLHVGAVEIFGNSDMASEAPPDPLQDYIISKFTSFERYFAWMFLYKSESESSMKLLIRTYDRKPYLLVWLLEPYVVMAGGVLQQASCGKDGEHYPLDGDENTPPQPIKSATTEDASEGIRPFPALKILYKIYDEESAATDPRANGGDSSVGIVDIPRSCCTKLAEILLRSSHSLPPTFRAVGLLYVGYLCLNESIE